MFLSSQVAEVAVITVVVAVEPEVIDS